MLLECLQFGNWWSKESGLLNICQSVVIQNTAIKQKKKPYKFSSLYLYLYANNIPWMLFKNKKNRWQSARIIFIVFQCSMLVWLYQWIIQTCIMRMLCMVGWTKRLVERKESNRCPIVHFLVISSNIRRICTIYFPIT